MNKLALFAASAIVGGASLSASAAVIVNDGFEYADQAAFEAVWSPIASGSPSSTTLDSSRAASGSSSATVPGTASNNLYRNRLSFGDIATISPTTSIVWSFDFYDSGATNQPQRNFATLQDTTGPTATNQLISMGLNNNQLNANSGGNYYMGRILGYTTTTVDPDGGPDESVVGGGAYFKLNDYGVGLRSTGWHNLKVIISTNDGLSADYAFYVDNQLAETVNNVGTAASAARAFDNIAIGSGLSNGSISAGFDNMYLEVITTEVPEPTTLAALAGLSVFGLARRRKA